jgi:hypothetical protein
MEQTWVVANAALCKLPAKQYRARAEEIANLDNSAEVLDAYLMELGSVLTFRQAENRIKLLIERMPHYLELHQEFDRVKNWKPFMQTLRLAGSCRDADFPNLKKELADMMTEWADDLDGKYKKALEDTFRRDVFMATYNLFLSPNLHSCNITSTRQISQMISEVAKIDRLPSDNSHEAMVIISAAWDHVDIYMGMAKRMKSYAKALYSLLLLSGMSTVVIVTVTLLGHNSACGGACQHYAADADAAAMCQAEFCEPKPGYISEAITDEQSRYIVLILSVIASLLASTVSYLNPAQRWQQLRGAALSLESEIWKFRTRSGE